MRQIDSPNIHNTDATLIHIHINAYIVAKLQLPE